MLEGECLSSCIIISLVDFFDEDLVKEKLLLLFSVFEDMILVYYIGDNIFKGDINIFYIMLELEEICEGGFKRRISNGFVEVMDILECYGKVFDF